METRFVLALACSSALYGVAAAKVDAGWHRPAQNQTFGTLGDWCNMPHVKKGVYEPARKEYKLKYVDVIHRHHKRTPYDSNGFPEEPYPWHCNNSKLFHYGQPVGGPEAGKVHQEIVISFTNPFKPKGLYGTCKFPQITAGGLKDSWQHGADLYHVYHDLLGFLPPRGSASLPSSVKYRVTNNVITSEVVGMIINGMWGITGDVSAFVQTSDVDSLEPRYPCKASKDLFKTIKSDADWNWQQHLKNASTLFKQLDEISGVPSDDKGFHESFDHYYDNLSARQCHAEPLPCNKNDATKCVDQKLADDVYRQGNWEYNHIYRNSSLSLEASVGSYGVWVAELAARIRDVVAGKSKIIYNHNVAHDGSVSRLLSILQIKEMSWPGMGSEIVFEVYQQTKPILEDPELTNHSITRQSDTTLPSCCNSAPADFSSSSECDDDEPLDTSKCSCPDTDSNTIDDTPASEPDSASKSSKSGGYYVRVLFGGKVLVSSSPMLGSMNMLPAERLLSYFDELVGKNAGKIKGLCERKTSKEA